MGCLFLASPMDIPPFLEPRLLTAANTPVTFWELASIFRQCFEFFFLVVGISSIFFLPDTKKKSTITYE